MGPLECHGIDWGDRCCLFSEMFIRVSVGAYVQVDLR